MKDLFSKMKIVKNSLRSSLAGDQFENVLLCAIESDLLNNIDLGSLANDWAKVKKTTNFDPIQAVITSTCVFYLELFVLCCIIVL